MIQITKKILCLMVLCFSVSLAFSQVPVKDKKHRKWSKIMEEVQVASQAINTRVTAFVGNIKDVQEFMSKASMVVNGVVKNIQMVRKIIEIEKDQILLAISSEATNVFDLFKNVIEEDATIMDDKGRLTLIRDVYKDATRIKATIRAQLRRINKEVYQYRRLKKEIKTYEEFFSTNS